MSLILYGAPLSPFVRKVRLLLAEKRLDYQLEVIAPFGQPAWYREISPLGRIPALRDGDLALADSSVICQYLEERYPEHPPLCGEDPASRATVRWLEKYADYELAPQATLTVFRNRVLKPAMGQRCEEEDVRRALQERLPAHFDYLENTLGDRTFFVGDRLSLADLAIASQLVNLGHAGEQVDAQRWPALAAHFARLLERPSMQALLPGEQRTLEKLAAKA
ncbi:MULTISPECIES: glutathione S-transferase family protein [Pseudomonas aeruginosa group]|uniref:Glutathione S-transferase family protein n=1 Tax=Pseudomonas aeruginosa TaxID=287 RepID=A0ABD7JZ37_PSEAI|nr:MULTISPECIES: glutathione S-transferase family protein [Pseudomonas aeruginosa group]AVR67467.1 glutathione S-transferase family protein [Pseudomonas paraeruginosa]KAB0748754.1 glutathione S-transferase family protein [Pseudomonas aeruginosa]KSF82051.1 glutathione S-transferase [Pseudomonas aeruginosa]KSR49018.1 glutathione S-transferase [Pseudomonas aeruginosa]MBG3902349.1 glutathione S-transferase family protein [Pseudomonas aeruginosa]